MYLDESKVLPYFGNMRYNSAAPDAFAKIVEVTITLDCEMLSLSAICQICLLLREKSQKPWF